jgi:acyl-CoA reductase-like NAD-dependent aldehyde dehydrogenase
MAIATRTGSPQFPTAASDIPPTSREDMDAAIATLQTNKDAWLRVSIPDRIALITTVIRDFNAIAPRWVAACTRAKAIPAGSPAEGEEWATGPYVLLWNLQQLRRSLRQIQRNGQPTIPHGVTTRPDGQVVAHVFPDDRYNALLYMGLTADVWMEPGVTAAQLPNTQALAYKDKNHPGKVALVLGAGNVSSIGPADAFHKLFVEDQVVLFKTNPVNAYLGPLMQECFKSLIGAGYLQMAYGGAAEGAYLCNHPGVDEVHITGSDKTFDAIVFGPGPEGAARKAAGTPLLQKRITGELGNVSPVIVVPGKWSDSDLDYHAAHLASMLTNNAGFNCNATRVILTHAGWPQREALLARLRAILAKTPPRAAYYPGARDRQQAFVAAHPEAVQLGGATGDQLPWTFIQGVSPDASDDLVFTTEAFCSLFAETPLPAASAAEFLTKAVAFCNTQVWGTLNATIIAHPKSLPKAAIDRAVADLRYGTVGVNYWAGTGFILGLTTWGAFPGHPFTDIQSGTGVVHNTLMFSRPQKSVMYAKFRMLPVPPWFVTRARKGRAVFQKLARFEAAPSPLKAAGIVRSAL